MIRITVISDTHTKHKSLSLPGGDLILHAGDISSMGHRHEVQQFCRWYNGLDYDLKVFIAGNHDFLFEQDPVTAVEIVNSYEYLSYLQDDYLTFQQNENSPVKIWGTPWSPQFGRWAFMLPRESTEIFEKWNMIPTDTDILITHTPPQKILDTSGYPLNEPLLGCEALARKLRTFRPKIHIFGHIHGSYGHFFDGETHFINASVLNEYYNYTNEPLTFDWGPDDNTIKFI